MNNNGRLTKLRMINKTTKLHVDIRYREWPRPNYLANGEVFLFAHIPGKRLPSLSNGENDFWLIFPSKSLLSYFFG